MDDKDEVRLTQLEKNWLSFFLDWSNPTTFMSCVNSVEAAGYKAKSQNAKRVQGSVNKKKCMPLIRKWLEEEGLTDVELKLKLVQGLDAMETKMFAHQGKVVTEKEVIPWGIRHDFLKLAMQAKGMLLTRHELTGKNGGPIEGKVDNFVRFPNDGPMTIEEWERQCAEADKAKAANAETDSDTGSDGDSVGATTRPAS